MLDTLSIYMYYNLLSQHNSVTTYFTHYGSYRTAVPFDLPMHNILDFLTIDYVISRVNNMERESV